MAVVSPLITADLSNGHPTSLLDLAIDIMPVPVVVAAGPTGGVSHVNQAAASLLTMPDSTLGLGVQQCFLDLWPSFEPDGRPLLEHDLPLTLALEQGELTHDREFVIQCATGARWVSASAAPLYDGNGVIIAGVMVFPDITDHKSMQARMAHTDRLATMGMLAAGVAHEINNPLAYALSNIRALVDELPELAPGASPEVAELATDALDGLERIHAITRGLGVFARVEPVDLNPVDLNEAVEAAIQITRNELKYRARLIQDLAVLPPVLATSGRLSQVFVNLLINAGHAVDAGEAEVKEIQVRTWTENDQVWAEVRDNGAVCHPISSVDCSSHSSAHGPSVRALGSGWRSVTRSSPALVAPLP